ncbi:MAG: uncharacterized protein QOE92_666 [Chloroflexota bacterium]|jgi:uncharacterized protein YqjF (DUF2071 family)|nr:uncharacterized protein [Chloroflexota bacterium]
MLQDWDSLTFVHWRVEPGMVQRLLPPGLAVDTADGAAWVSLVLFRLRVRWLSTPALPYATVFPEINVRTYVTGPDGGAGIYFLSLDAPRLVAVTTALVTYGLPYRWSRMRLEEAGSRVTYRCRRRLPRFPAASCLVSVDAGEARAAPDLAPLDHFLTARWSLFASRQGRLVRADVEHPTWPLARARLLDYDDGLLAAAGVPEVSGEPVVHYSPRLHARLTAPRPC